MSHTRKRLKPLTEYQLHILQSFFPLKGKPTLGKPKRFIVTWFDKTYSLDILTGYLSVASSSFNYCTYTEDIHFSYILYCLRESNPNYEIEVL